MAAAPDESPLIAALPPNTDYITYLTILEYQLTSENLHILNGILKADDGNLAKEIGWDLLRLVLPKLADVPKDATECLSLIAQKGNPREVVVRIAEELEKLGREEEDVEDDECDEAGDTADDDLRTFSGEATRIHLGEMKLDGMPSEKPPSQVEHQKLDHETPPGDVHSHEYDAAVFPALLSMLSIVHPRIKTQYPSRFLATSLPAALMAYRRMPVTSESTEAFLSCLEKLSGKQRPPLPARRSTAGQSAGPAPVTTLPDPEAPAEAAEGTNIAAQSEKDIIARLLQAVMLEVLEEYMSSLQGEDIQSMMWTKRLRESNEPQRIPGKPSTSEIFSKHPHDGRDALMKGFLSGSTSLKLDMSIEIDKLTSQIAASESTAAGEDDEPSDYPASPSQIPFPTAGTLLMAALFQFTQKPNTTPLNLRQVAQLIDLISPLSDMPKIPTSSVQDALNTLLLQAITTEPTSSTPSLDDTTYTLLFSALTQAFTITPDPQSRDDAHFIATKLLHNHPSPDLKLSLIQQTINCTTPPPSSIPLATPFTEGALRAVGVAWLKDEFLAFARGHHNNTPSRSEADTVSSHGPPAGIPPTHLLTSPRLTSQILQPAIPLPTDTHLLPQLLMQLGYYISLLNLLVVVISPTLLRSFSESQRGEVLEGARGLLRRLEPWSGRLGEILVSGEGREEVAGCAGDVYALEDAVGRLGEALGKASSGGKDGPGVDSGAGMGSAGGGHVAADAATDTS